MLNSEVFVTFPHIKRIPSKYQIDIRQCISKHIRQKLIYRDLNMDCSYMSPCLLLGYNDLSSPEAWCDACKTEIKDFKTAIPCQLHLVVHEQCGSLFCSEACSRVAYSRILCKKGKQLMLISINGIFSQSSNTTQYVVIHDSYENRKGWILVKNKEIFQDLCVHCKYPFSPLLTCGHVMCYACFYRHHYHCKVCKEELIRYGNLLPRETLDLIETEESFEEFIYLKQIMNEQQELFLNKLMEVATKKTVEVCERKCKRSLNFEPFRNKVDDEVSSVLSDNYESKSENGLVEMDPIIYESSIPEYDSSLRYNHPIESEFVHNRTLTSSNSSIVLYHPFF